MKKETRSTGLWRGLTAIFAAFLALVVGAQSIEHRAGECFFH